MRPHRSKLLLFRQALAAVTVAAFAGILGIVPGFISPVQADPVTVPALAGFSPQLEIMNLTAPQLATSLDAIAASGATWIRVDLFWPVVETSSGVFDWSEPDPVVNGALARGLRVLAVPSYTPRWVSRPAIPTQFSAFMTAAARHYASKGVHDWEIWNEPNLASNWGSAVDPAAYTATLKAAYNALKAVDSTASVLGGSLSPALDAPDRSQLSPLSFLKAMYAQGAGGYFDALAVHPSCFPDWPMTPDSWNFFYNLPQFHQAMVDSGDGAKKIWLTEYGAPTGNSSVSVSEDAQASMTFQAYAAAAQWPWAGPLFTYWQDTGTDLSDPYRNFGIIRTDGSPKPAYRAFEDAIGMPAGGGVTNTAELTAGQSLFANQKLTNQTTGWHLNMQSDGNLVLYDSNGGYHWTSNTWGNAGAHALMQSDGNLVVYASGGNPLWSSNTFGNPGVHLVLQNDNNLVLYSNGLAVWATGT